MIHIDKEYGKPSNDLFQETADVPAAKVLIVDDNESNLYSLKETLLPLDTEILLAQSGKEALRILLNETVAVILLDVQMPVMDGFETAALIRNHSKTRYTPIIFVTGFKRDDEHILAGYELGAVDYILKPVNPQVLKSKVSVFVQLFNFQAMKEPLRIQRLKMTNDLRRSNEELQQFAYIASHDLKEPLRSISGYLTILKNRYKDILKPEDEKLLAKPIAATKRMQGLIDGLLHYSRVNTHGGSFTLVKCEDVLVHVLTSLDKIIKKNRAQITYDPLPELVADQDQLGQLFQNLIQNAIKYRGEKTPTLHIEAAQSEQIDLGKGWCFSFTDNGLGIDEEFYERIFLIYQRLHTQTEIPGTGIGLSICKKIVERHNGRIWVESVPGTGSTFSFTLNV